MEQSKIRNFCIIAHIDHGKSTLADRLLEVTNTVPRRAMRDQLLDTMDLERERGITIKLQPVRLEYGGYELNLIDTPGHVDFTYEVSRSLNAVEGAILLVDAAQGIEAQTIANLYLALEQGVAIVPAINKIDLPGADVAKTERDIVALLGGRADDVLKVSAKRGLGIQALIQAVIARVPPPAGSRDGDLRALIFDSKFDEYRGVVAYVRVVDGVVSASVRIRLAASGAEGEVLEVGFFKPHEVPSASLEAGEIGYVVTGLKEVRQCRVGDTIVAADDRAVQPLPGYREVKPMVFAGLFPSIGDQYMLLRDALERLRLNDASLVFEPEHTPALGFGFRVGFLGLLHLEVSQERLRREYGLELLVTAPSVAYRLVDRDGGVRIIRSPAELADASLIARIEEPWVKLDVVAPQEHVGVIMQLLARRRGHYLTTEYVGERAIVRGRLPLASILVDFYDTLKSVTAGYASMNYELDGYEAADVVRLDFLVAEERVEALSLIVYRDEAYERGRAAVAALKKVMARQQFEVKIQAAIGAKVIAAERLSARRKDVTAKLYGGDVTRKQKLLKKQKRGKERLSARGRGRVPLPPDAYLTILKHTS